MFEKVREALIRECRLVSDKPVLIGVSGGPDSLSLLNILHRLGYPLLIAHINHKLRSESPAEATQLTIFAQQLQIPIIQTEVDVRDFANKHKLSIEEAARDLRYDYLFDVARKENVQAVAVGHNADDQVETVLMHFLRGAGLTGLKGLTYRSLPNPWSDRIPLIRPLLGIWRSEITQYCQDQELIPVYDQTNLDRAYFRNRLRHDLIPYLESYNPGIKEIIHHTADVLREDHEIILSAVDEAWVKCLSLQGSGYLALKIDRLLEYPLGMQRQIVRRAIAHHCPDLRDIGFETVERVIDFFIEPTRTFQRDLISGLRLYTEADLLWIAKWGAQLPEANWPAMPEGERKIIEVPSTISLGNNWDLNAEILPATGALIGNAMNNKDPYQAWLDVRDLSKKLLIRTRRPGDRFQPQGMEGHSTKISDFMTNVKVPGRARARWPLICNDDTIVWIPGYRIHHAYQVTDRTERILHLTLTSKV